MEVSELIAGGWRTMMWIFRNSRPAGIVVVLTIGAMTGWNSVSALANPSTSAPGLPLVLRPDPASEQHLTRLVELDALVRRTLDELSRSSKPVAQHEIDQIGRAAMALVFQRHYAQCLADRSEAAGIDFLRRADELNSVMRNTVKVLKSQRGMRTDLIERDMRTAREAAEKKLPALRSGASEENAEAVEVELVGIIASLQRYGVWLEEPGLVHLRPFTQVHDEVRKLASQARQVKLRKELTKLANTTRPRFDELPGQLSAAADALEERDLPQWQKETLTGPEIVARAVEAWHLVNLRTQRTRMLMLSGRGETTTVPEPVEELLRGHAAFTERMIEEIGDLMAADAARVPPQQARGLYDQYLRQLSAAALWCKRPTVLAAWEPPLATLAGKDPELEQDVENYVRATGELLRWRRDLVEIRLHTRMKADPEIHSVFLQAIRPSGGPALLPENAVPSRASLLSSAIAALPMVRDKACGRPATTRNVLGMGAGKSVAAYDERMYVRMVLPYSPALETEIDALRGMLLVTPTQGPLSLEAAIALSAAEQGAFTAVGGDVTEVTIEPLLTRFVTISDRSRGLLRLEPLPSEIQTSDLRNAILARFDLNPRWVAHEAFVVDLLVRPTPSDAPPVATSPQPVAQAK
jgi:hypothetical protein